MNPQPGAAPRLVLLVGSPRSGTTWLQAMLGSHDAIVSPQETDLFRTYLQPIVEFWDAQLRDVAEGGSGRRQKGLPTVLTTEEFEAALGALVRATTDAAVRMKPSASIVLEKSPAHSLSIPVARRFVPDLAVVHIIRDGRDVASSMLAASETWGEAWAPSSVAGAGRVWARYVARARADGPKGGPYTEVRYETLQGPDGWRELQRAFAGCGIDIDEDDARQRMADYEFSSMAKRGTVADGILVGGAAASAVRTEPQGFFRKGQVGSWRSEWSLRDRQLFAEEAGDLLVELGYEPDRTGWIGGAARASLPYRVRMRLMNTLARRLERWSRQVDAAMRGDGRAR